MERLNSVATLVTNQDEPVTGAPRPAAGARAPPLSISVELNRCALGLDRDEEMTSVLP